MTLADLRMPAFVDFITPLNFYLPLVEDKVSGKRKYLASEMSFQAKN